MQIKRMPVDDIRKRLNRLKSIAKNTGYPPWVMEQIKDLNHELKCRYNPTIR